MSSECTERGDWTPLGAKEIKTLFWLDILQISAYIGLFLFAVYNTVSLIIRQKYYLHIHSLLFYIFAYVIILFRITELICLIVAHESSDDDKTIFDNKGLNLLW